MKRAQLEHVLRAAADIVKQRDFLVVGCRPASPAELVMFEESSHIAFSKERDACIATMNLAADVHPPA